MTQTPSWSELRRLITRLGSELDVVVRSDPEVCGLSGENFLISLHHTGQGDCTVDGLSLVQCPNGLVIDEFMRWMIQAGYLTHPLSSIA
ncbi:MULTISPECIES: hypothetical protein [unclassified Synechococcus]|uniref:hypothetical protein n=1 Tax=unclassified Synechococcus TaxID=2626047 RepID=UPI0020CF11A4|nr:MULTISPECIES: hypothetical protein [unclassified Synechococcus]MCP9938918.1 hypothetical protein [Synechococcus sp. Cruz CV12-2-Slac-r]MCX5928264.1 hypothetical protein [Synechococcus sp. LacPavin_0920_WC12_MAG_50_7]